MSSATQTPQAGWTSVQQRYGQMSPSQFRTEAEKTWEALSQVKDTIVDQVEQNNLRPIDAVKSIACLTGSVFGYEEFHPRSGQMQLQQGYPQQQQKGGLSQN